MLLQPITVPFSKSALKPSVYTLKSFIGCKGTFKMFNTLWNHYSVLSS